MFQDSSQQEFLFLGWHLLHCTVGSPLLLVQSVTFTVVTERIKRMKLLIRYWKKPQEKNYLSFWNGSAVPCVVLAIALGILTLC